MSVSYNVRDNSLTPDFSLGSAVCSVIDSLMTELLYLDIHFITMEVYGTIQIKYFKFTFISIIRVLYLIKSNHNPWSSDSQKEDTH